MTNQNSHFPTKHQTEENRSDCKGKRNELQCSKYNGRASYLHYFVFVQLLFLQEGFGPAWQRLWVDNTYKGISLYFHILTEYCNW